MTLLTTQPNNQNTLDPLDTNQFTQQLVQFAQVEQQLKQNDQLATLVSQQKIAQSTAALGFVGETVVVDVDGSTASLANGQANWALMSRAGTFAVIFCLFLAAVWACAARNPLEIPAILI